MAKIKDQLQESGISVAGDINVFGDLLLPGSTKEVHFHDGTHYHNTPSTQSNNSDLHIALRPFFYTDEDVDDFLRRVADAKPTQVTMTVNTFLQGRKIPNTVCLKSFWEVMHSSGLYACSYPNWSTQIKLPKT